MKLDGAHVVVVGGSTGVGAAVSRAMKAAGASLSILALKGADLDEVAAGTGGIAYPVDLSDLPQLDGLIERIEAAGGPIDALILNAAISPSGPFQDMTAEEVRSSVHVNMLSHMELARQALPGMVSRRRGVITTTGSLSSESSMIHLGCYVPPKAGLTKWAFDLGNEVRDYGIRVHTFMLGSVKGTALANKAVEDPVVAFIEKRAGDVGVLTPEDVAKKIVTVVGSNHRSAVFTIPKAGAGLTQFRLLPVRMIAPLLTRPAQKAKRKAL